jgi:DnaJ-class molecular chaperone
MDMNMTKSPTPVRQLALAVTVLGLLATATSVYAADPINCALCHDDVVVTSTAHQGVACQDCHTNVVSKRHKAAELAELSGDRICAQCHRMAARALSGSVHKDTAGCQDCHDKGHVVAKNGTATRSAPAADVIASPRNWCRAM